jgi:hypothetical protein
MSVIPGNQVFIYVLLFELPNCFCKVVGTTVSEIYGAGEGNLY